MKCFRCGSFLYENDYCAECGTDVSTYKRIVKKSNELYNRALKLAKDRNLSGALENLEISLKMYKANVNARNLMGLIYVEMGDYAEGLAQWVISSSIQPENNMADHFMEELRSNRADLNLMTSSIRKYNKAVKYVEQGNYDIAEIQLKKLLNDNTNMVKASQLLALLLYRKNKLAEARTVLKRAELVDAGNPRTISYQTMVAEKIREAEEELNPTELRNKRVSERKVEEHTPLSGDDVIIPKSSYSEYNRTTMAIIQIIIGVIIGAAVVFFIVLPTKTKALRNEYADTIASQQVQIEQLMNPQVEEPETNENGTVVKVQDTTFTSLVNAQVAYLNGDYGSAFEIIGQVDITKLNETQLNYYNALKSNITGAFYGNTLTDGIALYDAENYDAALTKFKSLYDQGVNNPDLFYYLGRTYDYLDSKDNTLKYLRQFVAEYPEDERTEVANQIIYNWTKDD